MNIIRQWACGHLGPDNDPDGLCPSCQAEEIDFRGPGPEDEAAGPAGLGPLFEAVQ